MGLTYPNFKKIAFVVPACLINKLVELMTFIGICQLMKLVLFCEGHCKMSFYASGTWGHYWLPDGSVEDRRSKLVELMTFFGISQIMKQVLFCKGCCKISFYASGTWRHYWVPDESVEDRRSKLMELMMFFWHISTIETSFIL